MENDQKVVSVLMVTYNHEEYIAQAIEGVLIQKISFPIELVIGEDCSTDNTRTIIEQFKTKYPALIKVISSSTNIGMIQNFNRTLKACSGKYIALCDGDDYWTDPNKLQIQVDFLEANKDFSICFHNMKVIDENNPHKQYYSNASSQKNVTTISDLALGNFISTASGVFRNLLKTNTLSLIDEFPVADYVLFMLIARNGKIKYFHKTMGVYRIHKNGIWGSKTSCENYFYWIKVIELMRPDFSFDVQLLLDQQLIKSIKIVLNDENNILTEQARDELTSKALELFPNFFQNEIKENFKLKKNLEVYHSIKFLLKTITIELLDRIGIKV